MKPTADMLTSILHNFRVNGKFDQDRLIIGRGVDEQLQLMITDTIGIRYVPNGGSNPNIEYTNDGNTWHGFGEQGTVDLTYEPIEFTGSDLQDDGTIHIQHNFNDKNVLCLGYTPQPKEITYLDNEIVLDYSDQNGSNLSGAVWFVNSAQSMLVSPGPDHSKITVSGAGESDINGVYTFVPEEEYSNHLDAKNTNGFTNTTMWANNNGVIFDGINGGNRMVFIYRKNPSGSDVVQYVASSVDQSLEIVDVPLNRAAGSTPIPTLTWSGN